MFKLLLRLSLVLFLIVIIGFVWFLGQYKIVRTEDGFHSIRNKDWKFSTDIVDTRDWKLSDYWENSQVATELARLKFKNLRSQLSERWQDLSEEIETFTDKHDLKQGTTEAREKLAWLKEEARKRYQALLEDMEKGDINMDSFQKKVKQLSDWADTQVGKIKEELSS